MLRLYTSEEEEHDGSECDKRGNDMSTVYNDYMMDGERMTLYRLLKRIRKGQYRTRNSFMRRKEASHFVSE